MSCAINKESMNHKERMLAGLPYKPWLDGLGEDRLENKKKIFAFNNLEPGNFEEKTRMLKEILGKTGDYINTPRTPMRAAPP